MIGVKTLEGLKEPDDINELQADHRSAFHRAPEKNSNALQSARHSS